MSTADDDPAHLAAVFRAWGDGDNVRLQSPLMQRLAHVAADHPAILRLAAEATPGQPRPNLLFGAVHDLILRGVRHPLAGHYASAGGDARPDEAGPAFVDFVSAHRDDLSSLIRVRRVQTQVVKRAVCLLPAFAVVYAEGGRLPLALVEVGCSAGLLMQWDRFHYDYGAGHVWGDPSSMLPLTTEVSGGSFPPLPAALPVATRVGVDLNPLDASDPEEARWLEALTWPEDNARRDELRRAIAIAREARPGLRRGDAVELVPGLLRAAPAETTACAYAPFSMYQFPPDALEAFDARLREASRERPVALIRMDEAGTDSAVDLTWYRDGEARPRRLIECNAHGKWLRWLG